MSIFRVGDVCQFQGYSDDRGHAFYPGDLLAVAEVGRDGVLTCLAVDYRGRVFSVVFETIFVEEVRRIDVPPIPVKRFPAPWGKSDNEEDDLRFIWTGCPIGTA